MSDAGYDAVPAQAASPGANHGPAVMTASPCNPTAAPAVVHIAARALAP